MRLDHPPDGLSSQVSLSAPPTGLATMWHKQAPTVRVSTVWHEPAITAARPIHGGLSHRLHERVVKKCEDVQLRGCAHD
jgi:hypothetical protein